MTSALEHNSVGIDEFVNCYRNRNAKNTWPIRSNWIVPLITSGKQIFISSDDYVSVYQLLLIVVQ